MQINEQVYKDILDLKDLEKIFEETLKLFSVVKEKYLDEKNFETNNFRLESKIVFKLLHYVYSNEEFLDDDDDEEEKEKFQLLTSNLKDLITDIDDIDLSNIPSNFKKSMDFLLEYFNQCEKDEVEFYETLGELYGTLKHLEKPLTRFNDNSKIKDLIEKETLDEEEIKFLKEIVVKSKNELKNDFKKEAVVKSLENIYSENPINYIKKAKEIDDNYSEEELEEINKNLLIESLILNIAKIENKLKPKTDEIVEKN